MDVEFNAPEPPKFDERELEAIRAPVSHNRRRDDVSPPPPAGRTPGSAEGERDPADQSR